jgi:predicted amino acid dehydrogenase
VLEQEEKRGGEKAKEAKAKTKLEERQKRERRANDAMSKDANEANEARESAGGKMRWMPSNESYDDEVRVLCARARACKQYFLFMPFHPHMLERALSLGVRPVLLLRRHGSLSFG